MLIKPSIQKKDQAALLPKRSDQGTQVVFDDRTILPAPPPAPPVKLPVQSPEKEQVTPLPETPTKQMVKQEEKKEVLQEKAALPVQKKAQIPSPIQEKTLSQKQEESKTKMLTQADIKKLALANMLKSQDAAVSLPKTKPAPPQPPAKKKKSLLSLMKCYLDDEKGNSCMIRRGENRLPSLEEMKFICYEKQIEDTIIATWRVLYSGSPPRTSGGTVRFTFLIGEQGDLEELSLIESSGDSTFDKMVLHCIEKSVPFPPIPKHFGMKSYRPQGGLIMVPPY